MPGSDGAGRPNIGGVGTGQGSETLSHSVGRANSVRSIALVTSLAKSIANFRGPLVRTLVARGVKVYALAPDYDDFTTRAVEQLGAQPVRISMQRTGMHPVRDAIDFFRLLLLLRKLSPDACFCYFVKPVVYGIPAALLARIPRRFALVPGLGYVFTLTESERSFARRALQAVTSLMYKLAFRASDVVFFFNEDDIDYFVERDVLDRRKAVRLNGSGIELDVFSLTPTVDQPVTFLLMARLLREKGIFEYADAARSIKARHPDARFVLLGGFDPNPGGVSANDVRAWVRDGLIEWPGEVRDVRPFLTSCSVYVLPSYREGVPRSTQEAMAMGRAVITTDTPGCRETVEEGLNGFLVPPRDAAALARAMQRFIDDPTLISRMGRASRALAEQRFDVRQINEKLLAAMGIP